MLEITAPLLLVMTTTSSRVGYTRVGSGSTFSLLLDGRALTTLGRSCVLGLRHFGGHHLLCGHLLALGDQPGHHGLQLLQLGLPN